MVCCLLCFDDAPLEGDPRSNNGNKWQTSMMDAPGKNPGMCCFSFFCCPCAQYSIRERALGGDWSKYKCCMGYYDGCCFKAGKVGDSGSQFCGILEACCCLSCAVSSTRMFVMDSRNIVPDPCDNQIIRFNNCIQLLSCVCHIAAIFVAELRDVAQIIDFIADMVFLTTQACMTAQADLELKHEVQMNKQLNWNYAPAARQWNKNPDAQAPAPPQSNSMGRPGFGQQPVTQAAIPQQQKLFQVICPEGVGAGSHITVKTPEGQQMGVVVPPGVGPNMRFQVSYQ